MFMPRRAISLSVVATLLFTSVLYATHPSAARAVTTPGFTVTENSPLRPVPAAYDGFAIDPANLCSVVMLAQTDPAFVQLFKNLGPGTFRVGGNTGDKNASWSVTANASCAWKALIVTPGLVDSFFSFAESVGYRVMWQVPLLNNQPISDAQEAAYVATMPDLYSIEIGNEPNYYAASTTNYQTYINDWDSVYQDYVTDGGLAPITGPATTTTASFYTTPFLSQNSADLAAVTGHFYVGSSAKPHTCTDLLSVGSIEKQTAAGVASAAPLYLPFIMNETNSYSGGGTRGVSNAFCSGLWAADYTLIGLSAGVQGMYLQGVDNFQKGNSGGAIQYYTPINLDGTPAPEYYGLLFYNQMTAAGGNTVAVNPTGTTTGVDAYAVASGSGLKLALLNRNAGAETLALNTADGYTAATYITLSAPALNALSGVTLGGRSVATDGTWGADPLAETPLSLNGVSTTISVPADSAVIVSYTNSGGGTGTTRR